MRQARRWEAELHSMTVTGELCDGPPFDLNHIIFRALHFATIVWKSFLSTSSSSRSKNVRIRSRDWQAESFCLSLTQRAVSSGLSVLFGMGYAFLFIRSSSFGRTWVSYLVGHGCPIIMDNPGSLRGNRRYIGLLALTF